MRILHVCSWFQPTLGYSEYHLPAALQRIGCENAIATSDRYYPFPDYDATIAPLLGQRIVGPRIGVESGLLTHRLPVAFEFRHHLWLRGLTGVVRKFRPDVVQVYQSFTLPTLQAALAKPRFNYRLVLRTTMEKEVFYPQDASRRAFYSLFRRFVSPVLRRRVDAFTAVGVGARDIASDVLGVPGERIEILPLGADASRFRFSPDARARLRGELEIDPAAVVAIYAGKLIPSKDVHVLVGALARLQSRRVRLLLVGNGSPGYVSRLREMAGARCDDLLIRPAVPNSDLAGYFSAADIGVWPSESSNAAIEAALVGLPLIVSESAATAPYISARNGVAFPRGDAVRLAARLGELSADPAARERMGAAGRRYATGELSWDAIARRCVEQYQRLLAAPETFELGVAGAR